MQSWKRSLYIIFSAQLCTSLGFSFIYPFLPLYIRELKSSSGLSAETLSGLVFSTQAIAMTIASPIWGAVADRFGRKPMVVRAMIGGAVTTFLMGFAQSAEILIILRILQGLFSGVISASSALVASVTPKEKSGYAMGLLQLASWTGVALGPLLGGILSDIYGFHCTFVITSILLFSSGIVVYFSIDEKFESPKNKEKAILSYLSGYRQIVAEGQILFTLLLRFISSVGNNVLLPILPLFVHSLFPDSPKVGSYTGIVIGASSIASTIGAVYLGRLGDRTGHHRIVQFCAFASAVFFIPQIFITSFWQLLILYTLTGAAIGGLLPSLSALLAKNSPKGTEGSVYGFDNSIVSAGRAAAPLIGSSVAVAFSYRSAFVVSGLIFLCAAVISLFAYTTRVRSQGTKATVSVEGNLTNQ
jgi:DHA1 family multidrug resistance protein-like MFS transporter